MTKAPPSLSGKERTARSIHTRVLGIKVSNAGLGCDQPPIRKADQDKTALYPWPAKYAKKSDEKSAYKSGLKRLFGRAKNK